MNISKEEEPDEFYADVVVKIDGHEFKCHRVYLAKVSPFFDRMFKSNFNDSKANEIHIKETKITPECFLQVRNFIYRKGMEITQGNLENIVHAADFFQIGEIKEKCLTFASKNISEHDCFKLYDISLKYGMPALEETALNFIIKNARSHSLQETFKRVEFAVLHTIFVEMTKRNDTNHISPIMLKWISDNGGDESEHCESLLSEFGDILVTSISNANAFRIYTLARTCGKIEILLSACRFLAKHDPIMFSNVFNALPLVAFKSFLGQCAEFATKNFISKAVLQWIQQNKNKSADVVDLLDRYTQRLIDEMHTHNALSLLTISVSSNCILLQEASIQFICNNLKSMKHLVLDCSQSEFEIIFDYFSKHHASTRTPK